MKIKAKDESQKRLTIAQVLDRLPVSRRTLDRYVEKGELRAIKLDGKIVFDEAEFERFLKARTTAPTYKAKPKKVKVKIPDFLRYPLRKTPINLADPDETFDPYDRSKPFIRNKR
jgi:excisionase family DNA binding protein